MITDVRSYYIVPGLTAKYIKLFEEFAMPVQTRHGLKLIAYLVSEVGPLNHVLHIWSYDNMADMEQKRNARNADPDWQLYLDAVQGMLVTQENKIMRPSTFSPLK